MWSLDRGLSSKERTGDEARSAPASAPSAAESAVAAPTEMFQTRKPRLHADSISASTEHSPIASRSTIPVVAPTAASNVTSRRRRLPEGRVTRATRTPRTAPTDPPMRSDPDRELPHRESVPPVPGPRVIANRNEANPTRIAPTRTKIRRSHGRDGRCPAPPSRYASGAQRATCALVVATGSDQDRRRGRTLLHTQEVGGSNLPRPTGNAQGRGQIQTPNAVPGGLPSRHAESR